MAAEKKNRVSRDGDDFYSSLAAMVQDAQESQESDIDMNQLTEDLADLDELDADLFGGKTKISSSTDRKNSQSVHTAAAPSITSTSPSPTFDDVRKNKKLKPDKNETSQEHPKDLTVVKRNQQEISFDEVDPLAGLFSDENSDSLAASINTKKTSKKDQTKHPGTNVTSMKKPPKNNDILFDEDDLLVGMGFDEKKEEKAIKDNFKQKPAKSIMVELLSSTNSINKQSMPSNNREFVLDEKYTNKEKNDSENLFGVYVPSAASSSRPASQRSVRFQNDAEPQIPTSAAPAGNSGDRGDFIELATGSKLKKKNLDFIDGSVSDEKHGSNEVKQKQADWLGLHETDTEEYNWLRSSSPPRSPKKQVEKEMRENRVDSQGHGLLEDSEALEFDSFLGNSSPWKAGTRRQRSRSFFDSGKQEYESESILKPSRTSSQENVEETPEHKQQIHPVTISQKGSFQQEAEGSSPKSLHSVQADKMPQQLPHGNILRQDTKFNSFQLAEPIEEQKRQAEMLQSIQQLQQQYQDLLATQAASGSPQASDLLLKNQVDNLPASLTNAQAMIRRLQVEKHHLEILLESMKKRQQEEILAIENSYKTRMQLLEETHERKETRWKEENEQLLSQHLERVLQLEQEKSNIIAQNYKKLEVYEGEKRREIDRLKEYHRNILIGVHQDHEEAMQKLKEAKHNEIQTVSDFQSTSRCLHAVIEQIHSNAQDLGELQHKVDKWHNISVDEKEIAVQVKNDHLINLQMRLAKQQEENSKERSRLEDLISRLETRLQEQASMLDGERWKVKQEQNKLLALQVAVEEERKEWSEQKTRVQAAMDKARDALLEEQKCFLSQMHEERRVLAEERVRFDVAQKLWREQEKQNSMKTVKIEAEFDATMKAIAEERAKSMQKEAAIIKEAEGIKHEKFNLEEEHASLERERGRLSELASRVKKRSCEIDEMLMSSHQSREESERFLSQARNIEFENNQKWSAIQSQMQALLIKEKEITQEKVNLAKEKRDLENLKCNSMCVNCESLYTGVSTEVMAVQSSPAKTVITGHSQYHLATEAQHLPTNSVDAIKASIERDLKVRQWKIQAIKDKEYLFEESIFLDTLKNMPYASSQKAS